MCWRRLISVPFQAERDPDEEGEYMAFEQLMAEATAKREKKEDKKKRRHHGKDEEVEEKKDPAAATAAA